MSSLGAGVVSCVDDSPVEEYFRGGMFDLASALRKPLLVMHRLGYMRAERRVVATLAVLILALVSVGVARAASYTLLQRKLVLRKP